jgi:putative Holliday junction resolvase
MNKKVERVMAFDWGLKNIGVAVGTRALGTSQPCAVIKAKDGSPNWAEVEALIGTWNPALLVVGDPLNMDGSDAEITPRARRFARQLEGRFGLTVVMVDERLSSHAAKSEQAALGHDGDYRKRPIDAEAANLILQTWLTGDTDTN